jgi:hypothetical protein
VQNEGEHHSENGERSKVPDPVPAESPLRSAQRPAVPPATDTSPGRAAQVAAVAGGAPAAGGRGLPKRVRQQSLAPQLQHDETVVIDPADVETPATARSPEQLRRMMRSFQAGTARGRHASGGGDAAGRGTEGTTSDGAS